MTAEIACDMSALSPDERERHAAALATWSGAAIERTPLELEEGYEFRLPAEPDLLVTLAEFIGFEQRCCPFFTFDVRVDGDREMVFRITGPEGTQAILDGQ
jgi:hypothetical protein